MVALSVESYVAMRVMRHRCEVIVGDVINNEIISGHITSVNEIYNSDYVIRILAMISRTVNCKMDSSSLSI